MYYYEEISAESYAVDSQLSEIMWTEGISDNQKF